MPGECLPQELTAHLVFYRDEVLIMDMEAGIEHLGRGTAKNMDAFLVVVEPSGQSLESGGRIIELARRLGIPNVQVVINKVASEDEIEYIKRNLPKVPIAGIIPFSAAIRKTSLGESKIEEVGKELAGIIKDIRNKLAPLALT